MLADAYGKCEPERAHRSQIYDLPAIIADTSVVWQDHGKVKRSYDLPAIIHNNASNVWEPYLNDEYVIGDRQFVLRIHFTIGGMKATQSSNFDTCMRRTSLNAIY